jgi:c-di-GMP-binding flagellar brake protein YcgR
MDHVSMVDLEHSRLSPVSNRGTDRRFTSRFPVQQEVRYRVLQARTVTKTGTGKSLDVSSGGILFTTTEHLPTGRMVEIAMSWPARLHGTCPLQFVATGRVVRSDGGTAAVRIQRYEFRTRSAAAVAAGSAGV